MTGMKIAFVASSTEEAKQAMSRLAEAYGNVDIEQAEVIVALGGDGFMLRTLQAHCRRGLPVYGMKLGRIGFLMNRFQEQGLLERLQDAQPAVLKPLRMTALDAAGERTEALAFNEVSLLRQTNQAAHIAVSLNDPEKLSTLICDGCWCARRPVPRPTIFAHGPILPLDANVLALTPISPFRPRRWRGALLPTRTRVGCGCSTVASGLSAPRRISRRFVMRPR